jgi:TonB family protein
VSALRNDSSALLPDNAEAQAGVRTVADKILGNAERALTAQRIAEAVEDIEIARGIDASNPRLTFLDRQIERERERLKLDQEHERANQVRRLVQQARADIAAQRYLRPSGSNARDALLEARKLDPNDPAVALAIGQLTSSLTDAARRIGADTAQAKELLENARKLGATDASLASVERSWTEQARARDAAASRQSAAPTPPGSEAKPAPGEPATIASNAIAAAPQPPASAPDQWLQAIDLPRTREVAPDYPSQAFINGIEGWVDVDFTISATGVPENLRVRDSSPRRVFDRAALDSVRQWRFAPVRDNGVAVARRATLRVRFQRQ